MAETDLEIDGVSVGCVEEPNSAGELACLMKEAHSGNIPMAAIGSGTQLNLGNPPRSIGLGLRTLGMRNLVEYEPDNLTVSVQAGMKLSDLQKVLAGHNQFLPLDPPHSDSTLGGLIATQASGPLRFRHGTIRDMLTGIRVVHANGMQSHAGGKLVKNVTGYDMCKLYAGSLGTLAIISEATFKIQPKPESHATALLGYPSLQSALEATHNLLGADLMPSAIEAVNGPTYELLAGASLPASWALMLRFGDADRSVRWQMDELHQQIAIGRGTVLNVLCSEESENFWEKAARARDRAIGESAILMKCSLLYSSLPEAAIRMESLGASWNARTFLCCHAGNHILYGWYEWPEKIGPPNRVQGEIHELRRFCHQAGGHLVVERMPSYLKQGFDVWGYEAPALEVMRRIKRQFDPKDLLNPGRFVGGL